MYSLGAFPQVFPQPTLYRRLTQLFQWLAGYDCELQIRVCRFDSGPDLQHFNRLSRLRSEIGDRKMPDFKAACSCAALWGWLIVSDDALKLTTAGLGRPDRVQARTRIAG